MSTFQINVNMDKKCKRCGQGGATDGGYCMKCIAKGISEGKYDHILKKKPEVLP
jgi:hypothetical protein